jgi:hypothetical protein
MVLAAWNCGTAVFFCLHVGSDEISAFYEVISPRLFRSGLWDRDTHGLCSAEVRKLCFRFGLYVDVSDDCACPAIGGRWHTCVAWTG